MRQKATYSDKIHGGKIASHDTGPTRSTSPLASACHCPYLHDHASRKSPIKDATCAHCQIQRQFNATLNCLKHGWRLPRQQLLPLQANNTYPYRTSINTIMTVHVVMEGMAILHTRAACLGWKCWYHVAMVMGYIPQLHHRDLAHCFLKLCNLLPSNYS